MKDPQYKQKSELEKLYLDTTYSVFINKQQYDIKIGEPVPLDINKLLDKEKSAVVLTAWNPKSQLMSLQQNKKRNVELKKTLQKNNFTVLNALGHGNDLLWPAEESFFIAGIKKQEVENLAIDYGQYAYVWLEAEKPASLVLTSIWYE